MFKWYKYDNGSPFSQYHYYFYGNPSTCTGFTISTCDTHANLAYENNSTLLLHRGYIKRLVKIQTPPIELKTYFESNEWLLHMDGRGYTISI